MSAPSLVIRRVCAAFGTAVALAFTASLTAQIPTRNVNMVSGLEWPGGDPFLQRQNEPSIAASTRNPLHLLAGSNDYRSIDLAGILGNDNEVGDAWAGLYTSTDGGERWKSTLVPGFPNDPDPRGQASPLYGYNAAADPVVRAGTNGLMYYAGLAFDRHATGFGKSAIYVARFIDNNNQEAVSPFEYIHTTLVASQPASTGVFLDKPWMAVDIPRQGAGTCNITTVNEHGPFTQRLPAGNIYVAFTVKSSDAQGDRWDLYFSRSTDCGVQFSAPARISRAQDRVNQGASIVISPTTGAVFISWRRIDLNPTDGVEEHAIVVAKSIDQGRQFNNPGVARRFPRGKKKGLSPAGKPGNGKQNQIQASEEFELSPLDQATSDINMQFRTNAYPTMTADGTGRLYLAWTERGFAQERSDPGEGDARIVVATSADGINWTTPAVVSDGVGQKGHQLMPALSFAGGKLMMIYYDLQEDRSKVFKKSVDDRSAILESNPVRRHTFDVRVAMATPGETPAFFESRSVSSYLRGARTSSGAVENLQVNPPNLPMFKLGTVPFIGDYIDLAPSPSFVPNGSGGWVYNTAATTTPPVFHAVWTDNRDVKPPYTKNWTDYTPPTYSGPRPRPGEEIVLCQSGLAGSRNQNIYTARITGGLVVGSPQNSKQLSTTLQRAFVVFAQNTVVPTALDNGRRYYRMTILNQPPGGRASFSQFPLPPFTAESAPPLTTIDLTVPAFTTASRTVYVTSSDPHAPVTVDVSEIPGIGSPTETAGGLEGTIYLNADVLNPEVDNPEVDNPEVDNPEVDNAEVYNPEVDNPEVDNPEVDNPEVDNPEVDNPEVDNIVVGNPEVDNPEVDNPEVDNPEVDNPEVDNPEVDNGPLLSGGGIITDITWTIKNTGNTTAAYNVNLFNRHNSPPADRAQLLVYRIYKTPIIKLASCDVKTVTQNVLIANIPDPALVPPGGAPSDPNDSDGTNATLWIEPEQEVRVTLRVFDPIKADNININGASIDPDWVPESDVSLFAQSQPVNTPDAPTIDEPPLVGPDPGPLTFMVTSLADAGPGSLREAMTIADAMPGLNTIEFNLPGAAPHTISLATLLPTQEEAVIIDGSTQPGYAGTPVVTIDGTAIAGGGSGFRLRGGGSLIRGLAVGGFGDHGIWLDNLGSNEVYGNYVGFDATGVTALPNGNGNVDVGSPNNIVGGMAPADRNVIGNGAFYGVSVSSNDNRVEGNYIGTDMTGNVAAPQLIGVLVSAAAASGNIIGGNVISGHLAQGIAVDGPANIFEKNTIGLNAAGNAALPNAHGIFITEAANNRVIDNVISGNSNIGVLVQRAGPTGAAGTEITGNFIGTDALGLVAIPNRNGVAYGAAANTILGGPGAARNVISGNLEEGVYFANDGLTPSTGNVVRNNHIGVNGPGNAILANGYSGLVILNSSNNTIGSIVPGEGNVISGNGQEGIFVTAQGGPANNNVIVGNLIGTSADGLNPIPNTLRGILANAGGPGSIAGLRIGGENPGEGNRISGNTLAGIFLDGAAGSLNGTLIQGNLIGVGSNGLALGNGSNGVTISSAVGTVVGANSGGNLGGNVLAGNIGYGVVVSNSPDTTVEANYIGTQAILAVPNTAGGILVTGATSTNFVIGGSFGNRVSGNGGLAGISLLNSGAGLVNHNFVGLNVSLDAALPNNIGINANNAGATVFTENVVSGNNSHGIRVAASNGARLERNTVGLTPLGVDPIPNIGDGIRLELLSNGVVGTAGAGNIIGSNAGAGIRLISTTNTNVAANRSGTNSSGLVARPNSDGIAVEGASTGAIGGNAAARNILSGNTGFGVRIVNAGGVNILGNYIGVDATGAVALGNGGGIEIQAGSVNVGDPFPVTPNVIAGNTADGILVAGGPAGNLIEANLIGVEPGGAVIPNGGHGIRVTGGRSFIIGNNIAGNALDGVAVIGVSGITIANAIYGNGGLPIDLGDDGPTGNDALDADAGANELQNYPSITFLAGTVGGELFSAPNSTYTIVAYIGSAIGNARTQLGSVACNTDAAGHCNWGPIAAGGAVSGQVVTATATDALGNTSEMGIWFVVP
jgi:parallel beta-helix repeat protein